MIWSVGDSFAVQYFFTNYIFQYDCVFLILASADDGLSLQHEVVQYFLFFFIHTVAMLKASSFSCLAAVSQLSKKASITLSAKELRKREAELLYEAMARVFQLKMLKAFNGGKVVNVGQMIGTWNFYILVHFVELSWVRTVPSAL